MIKFVYEGVWYEVDLEAYETNKILLPSGLLIEAESWNTEGCVPKPNGFKKVGYSLKGTLVEVANYCTSGHVWKSLLLPQGGKPTSGCREFYQPPFR